MGFSRQEYWSGLPLPTTKYFLHQRSVKFPTMCHEDGILIMGHVRERERDNSERFVGRVRKAVKTSKFSSTGNSRMPLQSLSLTMEG